MEKDEFTDSEKATLQAIAKEREHRKWLLQLAKRWAQWLVGGIAGLTVIWDAASRIVKTFAEKP